MKFIPRSFAPYLVVVFAGAVSCVASSSWAESGVHHARTRQGGMPWAPRHRTGVVIDEMPLATAANQVGEHSDPHVLTPAELRRLGLRPRGRALDDLSRWPAEPKTPEPLEPKKLARALSELCPPVLNAEGFEALAQQLLAAASAFGVDPMLLGALAYHQSGCDSSARNAWGTGLTMLNRGLLPASLRIGSLRYSVRDDQGIWVFRERSFKPPLPFVAGALVDPATNLYTAAAMLRMFEDQCPALDQVFGGAPHRHFVSHFIWGDQPRGAGPEDGVLIARRRLIAYYTEVEAAPLVRLKDIDFTSPLDGAPRIVTSGLGEPRDGGRRPHAGIDYLSRYGEPVRAVADGEVIRAGSDRADGTLVDLDPFHAARMPPHQMGARGLFVEIAHAGGYRSVYAHLASYTVKKGDRIARGAVLGYVGRSGVRASDPHLHFGLFEDERVVDPLTALAPYVFAPELERRNARQRANLSFERRPGQGVSGPLKERPELGPVRGRKRGRNRLEI